MLDNCCYDKIKIAHQLSCLNWFIEKHAVEDANKQGDKNCVALYNEINKDLKKHLEKLLPMMCDHKK